MTAPDPLIGMARWASELSLAAVPLPVLEQAKNQILSTVAAVHAGCESDLGARVLAAFPPPAPGPAKLFPVGLDVAPGHAAFLMAAWSMVHDFDDILLGGHVSHSSVLVPLAFAQATGASGADVLLAQIAANEIAARINMAVALGPLRGQMATHVHLIAAAAARAKLERLDASQSAAAIGFALAYPARALMPAFLGSDAKVLCAAWPLRMGIEAVDAVRAGLAGNPGVLAGEAGFLATFADIPLINFLGELGGRWHTITSSFKLYPGSAYITAAVEATLALVRQHDLAPEDVASVDVDASLFTSKLDAHALPYVRGPDSHALTLEFWTPYNVACAILYRDLGPQHLAQPFVIDPRLWTFIPRIHVRHDWGLTEEVVLADIPLGAALRQAGRGALHFVLQQGGAEKRKSRRRLRDVLGALRILRTISRAARAPRPLDLSRSEKAMPARVSIRTTDGRLLIHSVRIPTGFAGSCDPRALRDLLCRKYLDCASPRIGARRAGQALELIERFEALSADELRSLVELNCRDNAPRRAVPAGVSHGRGMHGLL